MTKIRTYCDACILIAASKYSDDKYLKLLDDPNRELASSIFVKLETIPKPHFLGFNDQVIFLQTVFETVTIWPSEDDLGLITNNSLELAKKYDLNAVDALHVASAIHLGCHEMFSIEKDTKPMYKVTELKVTHLGP